MQSAHKGQPFPSIKQCVVSQRRAYHLPYFEISLVPFYYDGEDPPGLDPEGAKGPDGMKMREFCSLVQAERSAYDSIQADLQEQRDKVTGGVCWSPMWMVFDKTDRFNDDSIMRREEIRESYGGILTYDGATNILSPSHKEKCTLKMFISRGNPQSAHLSPHGYQVARNAGYCALLHI